MKLSEVLTGPDKWTQEYLAKDKDGHLVSTDSDDACKFCLMGAVYRVHGEKSAALELKPETSRDLILLGRSVVSVFPRRHNDADYTDNSRDDAVDVITSFNDADDTAFKDVQKVVKEFERYKAFMEANPDAEILRNVK